MNTQTLKKAKTFNGFTLEQVLEELQKRLSDDAYEKVPHVSYLISTNAVHTLERLTQIFGPVGVGFGLDWQPEHLTVFSETRTNKDGDQYTMWVAGLDYVTFWFTLADGEEMERIKLLVTGGSKNSDRNYAIKGARSNALGDGAKQLLFQLPVHKEQGGNNSQSTGAPIKDPGSVTVPFDKAKELFGGTAPTIDALYQEDPGFVEWICNKIDGDVGNAARQYMAQFSDEISQLSGNGDQPINNMASLMAYAKVKGHTFANPGALYGHLQEQLGWKAVPKSDDAKAWQAAASLFDGAEEGNATPEPFQSETTS